jgi:hypothetical protein
MERGRSRLAAYAVSVEVGMVENVETADVAETADIAETADAADSADAAETAEWIT